MYRMITKKIRNIAPGQRIIFGFALIIIVGMILLALPISSANGKSIGVLDALFTSTSGVCVTGLSVINTGAQLSVFGQVVLIILIQLGGFGFMLATCAFYLLVRKKISLSERMTLRDSFNEINLSGIVKIAKNAIIITFIFELSGFIIFCFRFIPEFGVQEGMFISLFQSISAFCNAGFDIFQSGTSLIQYAGDPVINITTMALIVGGGIGYIVIMEVTEHFKNNKSRFTMHTKVALITTLILVLLGFLVYYICEYNNPATMGNMTEGEKVMASFFQSVTTRTAGFASVDQSAFTPLSKLMSSFLMFVGASPGGTGGGIKTTTFIVIILFCMSVIRGKKEVILKKRSINKDIISRAVAIAFIYIVSLAVCTVAVYAVQHSQFTLSEVLYELISAFSTVGLSMGITPMLEPAAEIIVIIAMFMGRVGFLTITFELMKRFSAKDEHSIKYPEDKVIIG